MKLFKWKVKNPKLRVVLKFLLSLFISYHLAMIFIVPNRFSMLNDKLMPYFISYAQSFSLTNVWDFFAPNPAQYFYYEYEIISEGNQVDTFRWPPSRKESKKMHSNHNRLVSHAHFFIALGEVQIKKHFLPYLCSIHPSAKEVSVKVMVENRPHFKNAKTFKKGHLSRNNKNNMRAVMESSSRCKKKKKFRDIDSEEGEEEDEAIFSEEFFKYKPIAGIQ